MQRMLIRSCALALLLSSSVALASQGGHVTAEIPEHDASDPTAPAVTAANVATGDRFWPFRVAVNEPVRLADGGVTLRPDFPGVLVRVEGTTARVDFGRDGVREIPLAQTNLLAEANAVRTGKAAKRGPNFLYMVAPRLLDSGADTPRDYPYARATEFDRFLLVLAKPGDELAEVAAQLAPLQETPGLLTIVFPIGQVPDDQVRDQLRELGWKVPYLYDHLADGYAATLSDRAAARPKVLLVNAEGRLFYESTLTARTPGEITASLGR